MNKVGDLLAEFDLGLLMITGIASQGSECSVS